MDSKMEHVIEVKGLVNRFGTQVVHDNLNLRVRRDEILAIVGGSGTGKSVLLRSILGLHPPNAGSIDVLGHQIRYQQPGPHMGTDAKKMNIRIQQYPASHKKTDD